MRKERRKSSCPNIDLITPTESNTKSISPEKKLKNPFSSLSIKKLGSSSNIIRSLSQTPDELSLPDHSWVLSGDCWIDSKSRNRSKTKVIKHEKTPEHNKETNNLLNKIDEAEKELIIKSKIIQRARNVEKEQARFEREMAESNALTEFQDELKNQQKERIKSRGDKLKQANQRWDEIKKKMSQQRSERESSISKSEKSISKKSSSNSYDRQSDSYLGLGLAGVPVSEQKQISPFSTKYTNNNNDNVKTEISNDDTKDIDTHTEHRTSVIYYNIDNNNTSRGSIVYSDRSELEIETKPNITLAVKDITT